MQKSFLGRNSADLLQLKTKLIHNGRSTAQFRGGCLVVPRTEDFLDLNTGSSFRLLLRNRAVSNKNCSGDD